MNRIEFKNNNSKNKIVAVVIGSGHCPIVFVSA